MTPLPSCQAALAYMILGNYHFARREGRSVEKVFSTDGVESVLVAPLGTTLLRILVEPG